MGITTSKNQGVDTMEIVASTEGTDAVFASVLKTISSMKGHITPSQIVKALNDAITIRYISFPENDAVRCILCDHLYTCVVNTLKTLEDEYVFAHDLLREILFEDRSGRSLYYCQSCFWLEWFMVKRYRYNHVHRRQQELALRARA